jgi:quinol monooxygenase YgiN
MYTATMQYRFRQGSFGLACEIWRKQVLEHARSQPGFVRMQFLTAEPDALAIGTWREKADAEAFMQTGVFIRLMAELESLCDGRPQPRIWDLRYFESA